MKALSCAWVLAFFMVVSCSCQASPITAECAGVEFWGEEAFSRFVVCNQYADNVGERIYCWFMDQYGTICPPTAFEIPFIGEFEVIDACWAGLGAGYAVLHHDDLELARCDYPAASPPLSECGGFTSQGEVLTATFGVDVAPRHLQTALSIRFLKKVSGGWELACPPDFIYPAAPGWQEISGDCDLQGAPHSGVKAILRWEGMDLRTCRNLFVAPPITK